MTSKLDRLEEAVEAIHGALEVLELPAEVVTYACMATMMGSIVAIKDAGNNARACKLCKNGMEALQAFLDENPDRKRILN